MWRSCASKIASVMLAEMTVTQCFGRPEPGVAVYLQFWPHAPVSYFQESASGVIVKPIKTPKLPKPLGASSAGVQVAKSGELRDSNTP